jgi:hypothetical protein
MTIRNTYNWADIQMAVVVERLYSVINARAEVIKRTFVRCLMTGNEMEFTSKRLAEQALKNQGYKCS